MEKRPLAAVGFIYTATLAIGIRIPPEICCTIAVMSVLTGGMFYYFAPRHRKKLLLVVIPIVLGFSVISVWSNYYESILSVTEKKSCEISGEITDIPQKSNGRWYYEIKTEYVGIEEAPQKIKLRLTSRESLEAKEGDKIFGKITFVTAENDRGRENTYAMRADGIAAKAYCAINTEMSVSESEHTIKYLPQKLRRSFTEMIRSSFPEKYSGMLCAMLLGDTSYISEEIAENFRASGIAHLMAVSGFHVSLIVNVLSYVLLKLRVMPKPRYLIETAAIVIFMSVTGFTPSVVRAGVMHIMTIAAKLIRRDADSLTSLSLSLIIMSLFDPMSAADIGLQMSACSTVGIILFSDRVYRVMDIFTPPAKNKALMKIRNYFISTTAVSLTTSVCIMPLSAIYFGRVSLIAPLANLLCVYAGSQFITLGMLVSFVGAVPFAGDILVFIPRLAVVLLGAYLDTVTSVLSSIPLACVNADCGFIPIFLVASLIIVISAYIFIKMNEDESLRRKIASVVIFSIPALLLVGMATNRMCMSESDIMVLGKNNGGVCVIAKSGTHAMISEAGGESYDMLNVNDVISRYGIQCVDALAVSEDTEQRCGIADELIEKYSPGYLAMGGNGSYAYAKKAASKRKTEIIPFANEVSDSAMHLSLKMYVDTQGGCWQLIASGGVKVLVSPNGGDCSLIPDEFRSCDAVVIGEGGVKNIIYLNVGAAIVAADKKSNEIASILRVKGINNVYQTNDAAFKLKLSDKGLHVLSM